MATLLDLFGFLAVLLRAATLALGAVTVGGIVFIHLVNSGRPLNSAERRLLAIAALSLAIVECLAVAASAAMLKGTTDLNLEELAGAQFFVWGGVGILAASTVGFLALRRREVSVVAVFCAALLLTCELATSHAAARLTGQLPLLLLTGLHQAATATWIGGLPYLLLHLRGEMTDDLTAVARRFSRLSIGSVIVLFAAAAGLAIYYLGDPQAVYGTNYGLMVAAKFILFVFVLALGAVNFRILREMKTGDRTWTARLRRIGEAEIGIGITVVLAAASLTSQPPGVDLKTDRVTIAAIGARMSPRAPLLHTPPISALTFSLREAWKKSHGIADAGNDAYIPGQYDEPSSPGDVAWSEYNHHWAGMVVLAAGILAILYRFGQFHVAKYWPLSFFGLAVFLLLRADPETWPLGPDGFWQSFSVPDVAQHRMFVILIVLFALFELGVRTGWLKSKRAPLVFPAVCALGGALLLTHTHAISNVQEAVLAELSHLPIALLAVVAGWSRWLELRYPGARSQWGARIWPICFALIGVELLLYREA